MSTSQSNLPAVLEPIEPKPVTLEEHAKALPDRVFRPGALSVVLTLIVGGVLSLGGYSLAQSSIVGKIDAGVAEVDKKREALQTAFDEHLKDDREFKREVLRRIDEGSADTRALYKTVLTGERQYRLERPTPAVPDGGP